MLINYRKYIFRIIFTFLCLLIRKTHSNATTNHPAVYQLVPVFRSLYRLQFLRKLLEEINILTHKKMIMIEDIVENNFAGKMCFCSVTNVNIVRDKKANTLFHFLHFSFPGVSLWQCNIVHLAMLLHCIRLT